MSDRETAVFAALINGTKEAVWRELTRTDRPQDAMFHTVLHTTGLRPGASYQMRTPNGRYVNAIGEILEYDPPNRLKQTVRFVRTDDPAVTVTYEITDHAGGGVELRLTVEDIPVDTKAARTWKGGGGGDFICKTIKEIVETGRASLSTRGIYKVFDLLGPIIAPMATPNRTRSENWPMSD